VTEWARSADGSEIASDAPTAALGVPAGGGRARSSAAMSSATFQAAASQEGTGEAARPGAVREVVGAVTGLRPPRTGSDAPPTADRVHRSPATDPSAARRGPRQARLALRRVDPWSVLKVAFLLSLAMLVMFIVAVAVLYLILDTMGVFSSIDSALQQVSSSTNHTSVTDVFSLPRVIGGAAVLGAVNVLLFTALATLGAFLYNLCATIAGGIELTLTE
jgi:Transmembrane domain of unknown function (DUF3566)